MKTLADIFGVKIEKDMVKKRPMRVEDIDCSSRLEKYFKEHNSKVKHGNNKMREDFEKLPKIANIIPKDSAFMFSEEDNCYFDYDETRRIEGFINGAWYSFQEQQKRIDKAIEYLDSIEGLVWYEQIKDILK